MSGGITQLVAIGAQDAHLVGDPQVSFFKSTYKRHTNFSMVTERQVIQGNVSNDGMSTVRFERKGDLLSQVYIMCKDNSGATPVAKSETDWTILIDKIEWLVGGQVIDTQDSAFTENIAVDLFAQNYAKSASGPHPGTGTASMFYPLRFSFCENWSSAVPLVALQYHDVEIRITWGASATAASRTYEVYTNYIYLDTDERTMLTEKPIDLLITQVQKAIAPQTKTMDMAFNHPIKYLCASGTEDTDALVSNDNKIKLQINGTDVADYKLARPNFVEIPAYYNMSNPSASASGVFCYPFCLDTGKLQPSGTLNFSRLDSARLVSETKTIDTNVFAVNYNVLKINNGMGGLMYAN